MNFLTHIMGCSLLTQESEPIDAKALPEVLSFWDQIMALTLWGSAGWAIAFGVAFVIVTLISDYNENGWAITGSFGVLLVLFAIWGSTPLWVLFPLLSWKFIGLYLILGLGFAAIKTYSYAKKYAKENYSSYERSDSQDQLYLEIKSKLRGNVFRWWFAWPISMLRWIFADLIVDLYEFIWPRIRVIFESIATVGVKHGKNLKED